MPTRRPGLVIVALLLAVLLAACGDDGERADPSASTATTTLDPGVTFEEDLTVPTTGPGAASTTVPPPGEVVSEPGEVPPQFPADFPVPEGAEVEIGSVGHAEGEVRLAVDFTIADEDPAAVLDFYRGAVTDAGFLVLLDDDDGTGPDFVGTLVFETDTYVGNVLVSDDGAHGVLLSLTATLPD